MFPCDFGFTHLLYSDTVLFFSLFFLLRILICLWFLICFLLIRSGEKQVEHQENRRRGDGTRGGIAGNRRRGRKQKVSSGHDVSSSRDYSHISAWWQLYLNIEANGLNHFEALNLDFGITPMRMYKLAEENLPAKFSDYIGWWCRNNIIHYWLESRHFEFSANSSIVERVCPGLLFLFLSCLVSVMLFFNSQLQSCRQK